MTLRSSASHGTSAAVTREALPSSVLSNLEVQNPLLTFALEAAGSIQSVVSPPFGGSKRDSDPEFSWSISPIPAVPRGIIGMAGALLGRSVPPAESALMLSVRGADGAGVAFRCVLPNSSEYPELLPQALSTPEQALRALHHFASIAPESESPAARASQELSRYVLLPLAQKMGAGEAAHWSLLPPDTQRKVLESISVCADPALRKAA